MSSRHTRRKLAKAKAEAKLEGMARAEMSRRIAETVRLNKAAPVERNYYPASSLGRVAEQSAFATGANGKRVREIENEFLPRKWR